MERIAALWAKNWPRTL